MQIDQITANVRNRTPWEGVDLGFAMARQWFLPLWKLWWITALPLALVAGVALHSVPWVAGIVVWWFKPLYEPLLLFWLSRRLFGEELTLRQTLSHWRQAILPFLLANLTFRRLTPNRSLYMPVTHLEGLRGTERTQRQKVLTRNHSAGTWLTIAGVHMEGALQLSAVLMVIFFIPESLRTTDTWEFLIDGSDASVWLNNLVWLIAISVMAPFYVAGGFGLYLSRRSTLEAWDIELAFRRIAPRFTQARSTTAAAMVLAGALSAALCLFPDQAALADFPISHDRAETTITDVLKSKDFGEKRTEKYWRYTGEKDDPDFDWFDSLERDGTPGWLSGLATLLKYLMWLGLAVLIALLVPYIARLVNHLPRGRTATKRSAPEVLFGMDVRPDSLPADLVRAVNELLAEHKMREAMSLLYRATLARFIHERHIDIPDSATEYECQRIVADERPENESSYFLELTRTWVRCAYGHIEPPASQVTQLTQSWHQLFGAPSDA